MNTYPFLRVASVVESHDDAPQWYVLPLKKNRTKPHGRRENRPNFV